MNMRTKFEVRIALPVPEIIAIVVLGGGCEPPILGKRGPYRDGAVRKSVGEFIVTFSLLCLRLSETLPLLCSSTPLFPTHL